MSQHLERINKFQRVEMIEMGLNPLNPDHVQKYLKGGPVRPNIKENEERIKALMGDKLNSSLGHGNERDVPITSTDPDAYQGATVTPKAQNNPQAFRESLAHDMDDYANSTGNMGTGGLMSLREAQPRQQQQGKINLNEVNDRGKQLAVNYYNAFISSLKQPSTSANMQVYKALKAMLEMEQKLQNHQALPVFQKAVQSVTQQMYKQLKG